MDQNFVKASLQNASNRKNGSSFEELLSASLNYYYEKGYACIEKTPEPMRPIQNLKDGTFKAVYTKKAQPDYKGVLLGGQAVIFEAKYTSKAQIDQRVVTPAQTECLDNYQAMGARCFVAVCIQDINFFRVPWDVWRGMKKITGHQYMTLDNLEKYRVRYRNGVLLLLEGMELRQYR